MAELGSGTTGDYQSCGVIDPSERRGLEQFENCLGITSRCFRRPTWYILMAVVGLWLTVTALRNLFRNQQRYKKHPWLKWGNGMVHWKHTVPTDMFSYGESRATATRLFSCRNLKAGRNINRNKHWWHQRKFDTRLIKRQKVCKCLASTLRNTTYKLRLITGLTPWNA